MVNIQKLIEEANENGYQGDKASAKVCQDIVLKALSVGTLSRNVTIKDEGDYQPISRLLTSVYISFIMNI